MMCIWHIFNLLLYVMNRYYIVWVLCSLVALAGCTPAAPGAPIETNPAIDALAQCLTNNGATFYGTEWCPHCREQKRLFGGSIDKVNYFNCEKDEQAKIACQTAGVTWYPTWVFADGSRLVWQQSLEALAAKANCEFAPEALVAQEQEASMQIDGQ